MIETQSIDGTLGREIEEYERDPEFVAEGLALQIAEEVAQILKGQRRTQAWLAEAMDVTPAHVSRILNAPPNLTLLSIAKLAVALRVAPVVRLDSDGGWPADPRPSVFEDSVLDRLGTATAQDAHNQAGMLASAAY